MYRPRVIPVLLTDRMKLIKGSKFKKHKYIGDPFNAVKIFNEKEVDELVILDITATFEHREPEYDFLSEISSEAFFPLAYGGGITSIKQIERLMRLGIEKVILGTAASSNHQLVKDAVAAVGSQSVLVSVDYRDTLFGGSKVYVKNGKQNLGISPQKYAKKMENLGVGELMVTSINREGTSIGYDLKMLADLSKTLSIPIIASGGAGKVADFIEARDVGGVQAVSAGSMFVFYGPHRAVLINYPSYDDMTKLFDRGNNETI